MFAMLGEVQFEVIGSPEGIASSRRYDYAVHRVIHDRPRLQWLAPDLEVLRFDLMLHRSFTNPAADLAVLAAAAQSYLPLPLIFGSGEFRGTFVIRELSTLSRQLSGSGVPIAIAVRIEMLECPLDLGRGLAPIAGFLPIATAAAAGLTTGARKTPGGAAASGVSALIGTAAPASAAAGGSGPYDIPPAIIVRRAIG